MKKYQNHIVIRISGLKDGSYEYHFESNRRDLDLPENFLNPILIDLTLEKLKQRYLVDVHISTSANFNCDRCLEQIPIMVRNDFTLLFTSDVHEAKQIDEEEDVKILDNNTHEIDLTEDIREFTLVGIPMRITCGENENGKPLCGKELPYLDESLVDEPDTRWSELKKLNLK